MTAQWAITTVGSCNGRSLVGLLKIMINFYSLPSLVFVSPGKLPYLLVLLLKL